MNGNLSFLAWFIPFCTIAAGVIIWAIRTQPDNKRANAARDEAQWKRLTEEIVRKDQELARQAAEIIAAHQREAEAVERAIDAEAYASKLQAIMEGLGENRQDAQTLLAAQRLIEDQRKKRNGGSNGEDEE